jgi:hypothetical protein
MCRSQHFCKLRSKSHFSRINYRTHRKILVIEGSLALSAAAVSCGRNPIVAFFSIAIVPLSVDTSRSRSANKVDLPASWGPTNPLRSPRFTWSETSRPVASSDSRRADQRNHLAFVPAVNAKILVGCDHAVVWIKLAHPDQTKIGQIGLLVGITFGQVRQLRQMIIAIEREVHQLVADHLQHDSDVVQMECRFC